MLEIRDAMEGYYWARYKDHGWYMICVSVNDSGFKTTIDLTPTWFPEEIMPEDWFKYQDLREIKEPEFGE